jgi:hypothetical protein
MRRDVAIEVVKNRMQELLEIIKKTEDVRRKDFLQGLYRTNASFLKILLLPIEDIRQNEKDKSVRHKESVH